jgi:NADH dehydrogenase
MSDSASKAPTSPGSRVVIVGAGFAGLNAARTLAGCDVDITIVDRRNFHLFQPLLYQVATAALNPSDIAYPIRSVFRRQDNVTHVLLGEVTGFDLGAREVVVDGSTRVPYDHLIVASGATHSYFGKDEWESLAPGLKTVEDALLIRRRILVAFEHAEREPERREEFLTFVVVGAGPTGVELAGAMKEIAAHALADDFDRIDPSQARVVLVEGAAHVLPVYPETLGQSAQRQLEGLGVEVRTGATVVAIDDQSVTLNDGSRIAARTVLWAAGVKASPLGALLGAETDRAGRVRVTAELALPGHPEVLVIGDLAAIDCDGKPVPGVAPAAIQQGKHAAQQVRADLEGRARVPFRYRDKGSLATIGRARAVADLPGLRFSGLPAWLAWLGIHVFFLIGFRNRLFVILSWAWSYVTFRRGARIITNVTQGMGRSRSD